MCQSACSNVHTIIVLIWSTGTNCLWDLPLFFNCLRSRLAPGPAWYQHCPFSLAAVCVCVFVCMHVCLCVCVRLWVGDRRRAKNIPCLSTHIYHPSPRLLLIYSYSPSAHRLHNACTTQTLISKCLLVLIKGLFMSEQVWTGEHCRILQKQLVVRLLKSFLMKNTLRGVSHGSKHVLFSPCGPQSDRSLFKHNPSILGFQSCDVVQSWQKLSVPWWSAGSPADSISQNSYFCWLSEYFFKIGIQASESDATIVVPGLLCMLCSKHVVREFSREARWLCVNVLSVVMLILGRNWHWSASLRNTTQMFPWGEGQIGTRTFQDDVTEGVEGCCCQRSPAQHTWTDYETMGQCLCLNSKTKTLKMTELHQLEFFLHLFVVRIQLWWSF